MKVIFLDIDGVLNNSATTRRTASTLYTFVSNSLIRNLKSIIDKTNAKVVLSSDWRYDRDDPTLNEDFLELRAELRKWGISFYDFTPVIFNGINRGIEIDTWLKKHSEVSNFVILDDRDDMEPNKDHLVQTSYKKGLTKEKADEAVRVLMTGD